MEINMEWKKLRLKTTTDALDYMGAIAMELGLDGFEIEDNVPLSAEDKAKLFIDILPELPADEGIAYVTFYVEPDRDEKELEEELRSSAAEYGEFCDFGEMKLEVSLEDDNNWINNWKAFFKPFRIDEKLVIKPTWEEYEPAGSEETVIEIDPGTAFGTGAHETTKLCILALEDHMKPGDKVLDLGCGSGILSIAAMKFGAGSVLGIDIDEIAVDTSVENTRINGIDAHRIEEYERPADDSTVFIMGNVITDEELCGRLCEYGADTVVANILADVIIPLAPRAFGFLKKGGIFISSGIINTKEEAVAQAVKDAGFEIVEIRHMNDWVSIIARK